LATTRSGWQSIVDLSFCVFLVVMCGSVSLLTLSGASAPAYDAAGSRDRFVNESSRVPVWTADSESHKDLPGDHDDVDDSDDDDDDDDGHALADGAVALVADYGPAWMIVATPVAAPSSLGAAGWFPRGPPQVDQDKVTCSSASRISDPPFRLSAWTATDSQRQPQNSVPDNRDVEDRDLDDRDDDRDDDDDGDDESPDALAAASIDLTADHAKRRHVIEPNDGAHPPAGCETHSLRGPPSRLRSDCDHPLGLDTQSTQFFASARHGLHVPPPAIHPTDRPSRARKRITTETRSQL
jgi:hypothetical protein